MDKQTFEPPIQSLPNNDSAVVQRRFKCFRLHVSAINDLLRISSRGDAFDHAFRFMDMPSDVCVVRFNYDASADSVILVLASLAWWPVPLGYMMDIEPLKVETVRDGKA